MIAVIVLDVTYPEKYPDVAPYLDLANPHDAPKSSRLDLAEDKAKLLAAIEPTIEESLGMAMVFNIVTALKDAAEQLIQERATVAEQAREAVRRAEEEKENAKFHGEKVTRERFLNWRETFRQEMEEEAKRKAAEAEAAAAKRGGKAAGATQGVKLTGRELWEKGLARGEEEEEGEEDGTATAVQKGVNDLKVDQ
jgi:RWD domain